MKKKVLALAMAVVLGMTMLSGCGVYEKDTSKTTSTDKKDSSNATDTATKVVKYSITDEPPTLDPQLVNSMYGATLDYHLFEGLMRNSNGDIEPACAESYELSDDGLTYTFHLKKGLKWSDGVDLKAEDFVYGMQRLVDPKTASPSSYMATLLKNANKIMSGDMPVSDLGVKAVDDSTVQITLENPAGYFLGVLSTSGYYPCRKDLVEKYGKDFAADADKNVYNGPFKLDSWEHASMLTFKKNDSYWNKDVVKLNEVDISVVTDTNTALSLYESGDLDFAAVPSAMVPNYKDAKSYYTGGVEYLQMNIKKNKFLANKNLRNAMSAAIDREQFVKLATSGVSEATTRYVLPQVNGVSKTYGEEYPLQAFSKTADLTNAKKYLEAAMKELGVSKASDIKIKLNVAEADSSRKSAEVIQDQLQTNLGIKIEVNQVPYKQLYELQAKDDFEMMFTGWVPDYSDPFSYLEFFETGNGYNHSLYSNKDYDKNIETAKTSTDPKTRFDALFAAEQILCQDVPIIPLDLTKNYYLLNSKVTNFNTYFVGTGLNYIQADITQ